MKTCTRCGRTKPQAEFHRLRSRVDGRRSECGDCARERQRISREGSLREVDERTQTCPQCSSDFTYVRVGKVRIYCSVRCKYQASDAKRALRVHVDVRRCACGSAEVAKVGRPVCPACKVDKRDPAAQRAKERRRTLRLYGLTAERFDAMLTTQNGRCAICRSDDPGRDTWNIDHDHACCPGKGSCGNCVRGLLCQNCNLMIGHAKDDAALLQQAIAYLGSRRLRSVVNG